MPISYQIDAATGLVRITGSDYFPLSEWQATILAVLADSGFKTGFHFLEDHRQAHFVPSPNEMMAGTDFLKTHANVLGYCKWAIVVSGIAPYGMTRMASAFAEDVVRVTAFYNLEEALAWLRE